MSAETEKSNRSSRYLLGLGILLTLVVFGAFVYSHAFGEVCGFWSRCISKWEYLKRATPNEIGDTLAGYAGTLAFVWIVVTVCLQAIELREQRLEVAKMAAAQTDQVTLMEQQTDALLADAELRQEDNFGKLLDIQLEGISSLVDLEARFFSGRTTTEVPIFVERTRESADLHLFRNKEFAEIFFMRLRGQAIDWTSRAVEPYNTIARRVSEVSELRSSLPQHQITRLRNIGLWDFEEELTGLLGSGVWRDECSDPMNSLNFLRSIT